MSRFRIKYNIGKELQEKQLNEKLTNLEESKLYITDTHNELPDLQVENKEKAREYIEYFNNSSTEKIVTDKIIRIRELIEDLNKFNSKLLYMQDYNKYNDTDEISKEINITTTLMQIGYDKVIEDKTRIINSYLTSIEKILYE